MMEIDSDSEQSSTKKKIETLQGFTLGPLTSSISKLSFSSRGIPSDEDFHFYYNFIEFKKPIKEIVKKTESTLKSIGTSTSGIWGKNLSFPDDLDDAYDWLVNINDELFERFDSCVDEFKKVRKMEEESGKRVSSIMDEDGFQLVGKKKKGENRNLEKDEVEKMGSSSSAVKTVSRDARTTAARPRVPFHIPSITRPQREFKMVVDNSNEPFEHFWLEKSEDGSRVIHPLVSRH
ncbi:Rrp6-like [Thalictrum thalictroides]|uniref:Rrp6-like n=1 Tax=Thalictrum thalictroides TaxID=46969 RepID=A0A7J6WNK1_THATH|nr:Rrp6-like [Thalictrum thalictroides]